MDKEKNRLVTGLFIGMILCIPPVVVILGKLDGVKAGLISYVVSVLVIQELIFSNLEKSDERSQQRHGKNHKGIHSND